MTCWGCCFKVGEQQPVDVRKSTSESQSWPTTRSIVDSHMTYDQNWWLPAVGSAVTHDLSYLIFAFVWWWSSITGLVDEKIYMRPFFHHTATRGFPGWFSINQFWESTHQTNNYPQWAESNCRWWICRALIWVGEAMAIACNDRPRVLAHGLPCAISLTNEVTPLQSWVGCGPRTPECWQWHDTSRAEELQKGIMLQLPDNVVPFFRKPSYLVAARASQEVVPFCQTQANSGHDNER